MADKILQLLYCRHVGRVQPFFPPFTPFLLLVMSLWRGVGVLGTKVRGTWWAVDCACSEFRPKTGDPQRSAAERRRMRKEKKSRRTNVGLVLCCTSYRIFWATTKATQHQRRTGFDCAN
jgi:hypothetical protein